MPDAPINDNTEAATAICPAPGWYAVYAKPPHHAIHTGARYTTEGEERYRVPLCCWQVGEGAGLVFGMIAAPTPMQAEQFDGFLRYQKK